MNQRLECRRKDIQPVVQELHTWRQTERAKLSRSSRVAGAIDCMLKRRDGFTSFPGRTAGYNAAETSAAVLALPDPTAPLNGAAFMATLIMSATFNDIDPQAWLADVLARRHADC